MHAHDIGSGGHDIGLGPAIARRTARAEAGQAFRVIGKGVAGQRLDAPVLRAIPELDQFFLDSASGIEALGGAHGCALFEERLKCWGANSAGQLARDKEIISVGTLPTDMGTNLPFLQLP